MSRLVATLTTIAAPGDCSVDRAVNSAGQHAPDRGSAAIPPRARTPAYDSAGRISDNAWVTEATGCAP